MERRRRRQRVRSSAATLSLARLVPPSSSFPSPRPRSPPPAPPAAGLRTGREEEEPRTPPVPARAGVRAAVFPGPPPSDAPSQCLVQSRPALRKETIRVRQSPLPEPTPPRPSSRGPALRPISRPVPPLRQPRGTRVRGLHCPPPGASAPLTSSAELGSLSPGSLPLAHGPLRPGVTLPHSACPGPSKLLSVFSVLFGFLPRLLVPLTAPSQHLLPALLTP